MKDGKLVYSTDPELNKKCPKCKELLVECVCAADEPVQGRKYVPVLRIEKAGRGGKTVTVVDQLPKNEIFLRDLTTQLKKKCGSGGTYSVAGKEGLVEVQGDKRDIIRSFFEKQGVRVKG